MKKKLALSLISFLHIIGYSQQSDVPVILFQNTLIQTNPATVGLNYKQALNAVYHQDHLISDYNVSANLNYAVRPDSARYGIGLSYMYDNWYDYGIKDERTQVLLLHYAHHFRLGGSSVLSIGVSGGVRFQKFDYYWIVSQSPTIPLLSSNEKQARFQCNAGIALHLKNFNTGFSVTQLNSPKYNIDKNSYTIVKPDYWFFADYTFVLPARFELKPQLQVVTDAAEVQPYTSLMVTYNKRFWAGANYAPDLYAGGMAGIAIREKYRIGMVYGTYNSKLYNSKIGRMFEVVLAFVLK